VTIEPWQWHQRVRPARAFLQPFRSDPWTSCGRRMIWGESIQKWSNMVKCLGKKETLDPVENGSFLLSSLFILVFWRLRCTDDVCTYDWAEDHPMASYDPACQLYIYIRIYTYLYICIIIYIVCVCNYRN
jgi:hypothetical protein